MRIRVRFDPHSPLLLGTGHRPSQVQESSQVISGSTVLGAVARELLSRDGSFREDPFGSYPAPSAELEQLLSLLRFSPLIPVPASVAGAADKPAWRQVEGLQAPGTARTCKHNPGFGRSAHPAAPTGDGVFDTLLQRIARNRAGERPETPGELRCPKSANHRMERFRSLIYRVNPHAAYGEVSLHVAPRTRVGLNRATETAEDGSLFHVEPLEPRVSPATDEDSLPTGYVFIGDGWMPDELWTVLDRRLGPATGDALTVPVTVGAGRTRGYGWGELLLIRDPDTRSSVAHRFNRWKKACPPDARGLIVPALLRSPWPLGDPARSPGDEVLWSDPPPERLRDRFRYAPEISSLETEPWGGWSMTWGLPKTRRTALSTGSVLAFRLQDYRPDTDDEPLLTWLDNRETRPGASDPGTGWLTWCDPFHLDHRPVKEDCA